MNILYDLMNWLTEQFRERELSVVTAIVATLLVVYGNDINRFAKRNLVKLPFLVRFISFILICAIGYGMLTVYGIKILIKVLELVPHSYQGVTVLGIFIAMGLIAERRKQV